MSSKNNKFYHRLASALLTGAMVVSMLGMSVSATGSGEGSSSPIDKVTITKEVSAEENVLAPNTQFTFTVKPVAADTTKEENGATVVVYKGIENGAKFLEDADTIEFQPGDALERTTDITLDASVFSKPGVYRYEVKETTPAEAYDGMSYSDKTYYLDVYVMRGEGDALEIQAAILVDADTNKKEGDPTFTNTYTTNNVTLTKIVEGNQADMSKEFQFDILIDGSEGEKYTVVYSDGTTSNITLVSGTSQTINLSDKESITIYGLSSSDNYTITEHDYSNDGYEVKTSVTTGESAAVPGTELEVTGNTAEGDADITYTNTKEVATPTGVVMSIMPYALMVALAGVLAFMFLRRRRTNEF